VTPVTIIRVRRRKPLIANGLQYNHSVQRFMPIGRSGFAAGWGSGLRKVRGSRAGHGWVNSDRVPWDCPAIVAGFSSYARKGIAMSKLRKRMIQDMRLAGLVEGTQNQYVRAVRQLTAYYMISPDHLSERHVEKYLLYIRDELGVARGTFVPAFFGLKFFYVQTLGYDWPLFTKKESASRASSGCPMSAVTPIAAV
jgi:hypothetical protein